ncbi:hypothetical protein D1AOALGA4SA_8280 [Olavius algarvensis Delta 1 endosymbiont]|nr:hypothetical protein D1AOALGA4SA_8280 [Olavius algarvensis Delta 1 endosymbiont]
MIFFCPESFSRASRISKADSDPELLSGALFSRKLMGTTSVYGLNYQRYR